MNRLDIDDFDKKYTPVSEPKSYYMDNDSQIGMFETMESDLESVKLFENKFIWTALDSKDDDGIELHPGMIHEDIDTWPIYYIVTNEEWHNKDEIYYIRLGGDEEEFDIRNVL